jgi:hypothetical protein
MVVGFQDGAMELLTEGREGVLVVQEHQAVVVVVAQVPGYTMGPLYYL